MAKQIFYLQSCDEWKSFDSMQLLFIGTSRQKLMMAISKQIEEGSMVYKPVSAKQEYIEEYEAWKWVEIENSPKKQAKLFRLDWRNKPFKQVVSLLEYGYVGYTFNNESM